MKKLFLVLSVLGFVGIAAPARAQQVKTKCPNNEYPLFQTVDNADGRFVQPFCIDTSGNVDMNGASVSGKAALKPAIADGLQFVTAEGSDSNDGKSWGTAKLTITAAVNALPSCVEGANTYTHCGLVQVGAGTFTSTLSLTSPYVFIIGQSARSTVIQPTITTGCAVTWTSTPFNSFATIGERFGGLYNVTIDGTNASAGTCGLETLDIIGFTARGVIIQNFVGAGSSGWWDNNVSQFNERFDVAMDLSGNTTNWLLTDNKAAGNGDFGYGSFRIGMNVTAGNTGIKAQSNAAGGAGLNQSFLQIIMNLSGASPTGLKLVGSSWNANIGSIRIEGGTTPVDVSLDATSSMDKGLVFLSQDQPGTNSIPGGATFNPEALNNPAGAVVPFNGPLQSLITANPPATVGALEISKNELIAWRNQANTGNDTLGINASDNLSWSGAGALTFPTAGTLATTSQLPLSGSVAGSTTSLAANSCGDAVTATITGAAATMVATASPQAAISAGLTLSTPFVSAANTVSVGYCNATTASITPAAATFNIRVIQ